VKSDKSCIANLKSEIANWTSRLTQSDFQFVISDLQCRICPISNSYNGGPDAIACEEPKISQAQIGWSERMRMYPPI
jgi:hypothetical protein